MGQHKHNPTAIAAKNGELPPKKGHPDKRAVERAIINGLSTGMASMFGMSSYDPDPYSTYQIMNPRTSSKFHK